MSSREGVEERVRRREGLSWGLWRRRRWRVRRGIVRSAGAWGALGLGVSMESGD